MKKKIVGVLFILVAIMLLLTGCKSTDNKSKEESAKADVQAQREYQDPIEKYFKGLNKCDADTYLSAYPEFMDKSETIKDRTLTERKRNLERTYGDNVKYEFKILSETEIKDSDLKNIEEYISDRYKEKIELKKGYKVKIEQKIKGDKDFDYATDVIYVYSIDGTWYVMDIYPEMVG